LHPKPLAASAPTAPSPLPRRLPPTSQLVSARALWSKHHAMSQAWGSALRGLVEARRPGTGKFLEGVFGHIPLELRRGPWAWSPILALIGLAATAVSAARMAAESFEPMPAAEALRSVRLAGFLFGSLVLVYMFGRIGSWPMVSWTMLGWSVTTLRCLAGGLGFWTLQRILTFPSLLANTVTVVVWYLVIVPGILAMTPTPKRWAALKRMVFTLFLIIVHGINWVFCFVDWYVQPVRLDLFDLWAGLVYGLLYIAFYLLVLDPLGIHLYFILSPRKWWGGATYVGIMLLKFAIWWTFNSLESRINGDVITGGSVQGDTALY